jgi:hypothetical protein
MHSMTIARTRQSDKDLTEADSRISCETSAGIVGPRGYCPSLHRLAVEANVDPFFV